MTRRHAYVVKVEWTGNTGAGTLNYRSYARSHVIRIADKPDLLGSADPAFRGDPRSHNPEELLVSALSACHMLWYLHLCAEAGISIVGYRDDAEGTMVEEASGGGCFQQVVLRPHVIAAYGTDIMKAAAIHETAHAKCFIARSVNFPVSHEPVIILASTES